MIPAFTVRHLRGEVRAYDEQGNRLAVPSTVAAAWAAEPGMVAVELRPEPPQVAEVMRLNDEDKAAQQHARALLAGAPLAVSTGRVGARPPSPDEWGDP